MAPATKWTIAAIRRENKARGMFFFSPATMRAFASKVDRNVYEGPGGVYFVTSEQFRPSEGRPDYRRYTVRRFDPRTGDVSTVIGTHQKYVVVDHARRHAQALADPTAI